MFICSSLANLHNSNMHPNIGNISELSNRELEEKISKLNSYYFLTDNQSVRQQMILILDDLKLELEQRRIEEYKKQSQRDDNNDLDGLINIS